MFKDVFVLKKTSWHVRMMKYIWGLDYKDFSHMCPYWWLSVFNFLIAIWVVGFIKEGIKLITLILTVVGEVFVVCFKFASPPFKWIAARFNDVMDVINAAAERKRIEREEREELERIRIRKEKEAEIARLKKEFEGKSLKEIIIAKRGKLTDTEKSALAWHHGGYEVDYQVRTYPKYNTAYKKPVSSIEDGWGTKIEEPTVKTYTFDEYERKKMIERKEYINKINNIVRPIVKVIGYTLGTLLVTTLLYGLWLSLPYIGIFFGWIWIAIVWLGNGIVWLGKGLIYCIVHIPDLFKGIGKNVSNNKSTWGFIFLLISTVILLIIFLVWYSDHKHRVRCNLKKTKGDLLFLGIKSFIGTIFMKIISFIKYVFSPIKYLAIPFKILGKLFIEICKQIGNFFKFAKKCFYFLIQMLKNQCPAIKWED